MRGATRSCRRYCRSRQYFNPRSSCEERRVQAKRRQGVLAISIHAPHARSDFHDVRIASICRISIHAPHARSDDDRRSKGQPGNQISIHAPHARSDALSIQPTAAASFQSTLLMRGATDTARQSHRGGVFQSTLLMRGATSVSAFTFGRTALFQSTLLMRGATRTRAQPLLGHVISIHAPHARSDTPLLVLDDLGGEFQSTLLMRGATPYTLADMAARFIFQSTLLMRGATPVGKVNFGTDAISIHAPHARSDCHAIGSSSSSSSFQSTLLMRGATPLRQNEAYLILISIHAPHARSDTPRWTAMRLRGNHFNPRSSCEERPDHAHWGLGQISISIHAPHARSDEITVDGTSIGAEFQSTLLMRGATRHNPSARIAGYNFNPRSSCEERPRLCGR